MYKNLNSIRIKYEQKCISFLACETHNYQKIMDHKSLIQLYLESRGVWLGIDLESILSNLCQPYYDKDDMF